MTDAPYMLLIGIDTEPAELSPEETTQLNDAWDHVHVPDVVEANPGFLRGTRYELVTPDPTGVPAPKWLIIYELQSEQAANDYIARVLGPPEERPARREWTDIELRSVWRTVWQRLVPAHGALGDAMAPYVRLIGKTLAEGVDEAAIAQFNEHYNNVHIPTVVERQGYRRGSRYELLRSFDHPEPGAPEYLAVYEADETFIRNIAQREVRPDVAPARQPENGPAVWDARQADFVILYRRLGSYPRRAHVTRGV